MTHRIAAACAAIALLLGAAGAAQAGELDTPSSTLGVAIGGLPTITISALPGTSSLVSLTDGSLLGTNTGHNAVLGSTVWSTINFGPGTSLFTGVPLISNLKVTVHNQAGTLQDGFTVTSNSIGGGGSVGPAFGGVLRLSGQAVVNAGGGAVNLPVALSVVGGNMGETTTATLINNNITITAGPFQSGAWVITAISTNVITIPARGNIQGVGFTLMPTPAETVMTPSTNGGFRSISSGNPFESHTVTVTGTNNLVSGASSQAGMVTVIAPMRIETEGIAGRIPGSATMTLNLVPEPGTVLLLVSGAVGLVVLGRRRMRK